MKVLYLFNNSRLENHRRVLQGQDHDNHFFSMLRLGRLGVEADFLELEKIYSAKVSAWLRGKLGLHFVHLPLFLRFFAYDAIFSSSSFGVLLIWSLLGLRRPKWVVYDYNVKGLIGQGRSRNEKLFRFVMSRVSGIITLSKAEADDMKRLFPRIAEHIAFIPLGADLEYFKPSSEPRFDNFVLSVGRDPGRDYATLIEAMKGLGVELRLTAPRASVRIEGELPDFVTFHNFSPTELKEQYDHAKLVILPLTPNRGNENDAMGCSTLVEALAMGKAIIASRTKTMESYITDNENGVLVPLADVASMRQAIKSLVNDTPELKRLGAAARKFAEQECSAEKMAERMADYFTKLTKPK